MEVTLLDTSTLKIKGKKAAIIVDPTSAMPRNVADAVLVLDLAADTKKVDEYRLLIKDDGEYEVGSIKISGASKVYTITVDSVQLILAKASSLGKLQDTANEADIAVINVDSELNESLVASLEAKVVILYGEKSSEGIKALGKQDLTPIKKFVAAKEFPEDSETEIVWLQ